MRFVLLATAVLAPLAGCVAPDESPEVDGEAIAAEAVEEALAEAGSAAAEAGIGSDAPGALVDVVPTTDGEIEMGVTDEVVFTRLSAATRDEIAAEMARETKDEEGLGGVIARAVTGAVAEGLRTTVSVPLADLADLRYEDGRIVIERVDGGDPPFQDASTNDRPLLEQFDADAGRRLAAAFDKAKGR